MKRRQPKNKRFQQIFGRVKCDKRIRWILNENGKTITMSLKGRNEKVKIFIGLGTKSFQNEDVRCRLKVGGDELKAYIERLLCQPLAILLEHTTLHP